MTRFTVNRDHHPTDRPKVARPVGGDGYDANGRVGLDSFRRVTRDEATEHMAHHIALACIFYEATPTDAAAVLAEVERLLSSGIPGYDGRDVVAARAFLAAMNEHYAKLKVEQDAAEQA